MTVKQVAVVLGVTAQYVRSLIRERKLKATRAIGSNSYNINETEVQRFKTNQDKKTS